MTVTDINVFYNQRFSYIHNKFMLFLHITISFGTLDQTFRFVDFDLNAVIVVLFKFSEMTVYVCWLARRIESWVALECPETVSLVVKIEQFLDRNKSLRSS